MKTFYFSLDFEARGPNYATNGVNGLGIVVFDADGNKVDRYETGIAATNGRQMDPATKREFWDKQPAALAWLAEHEQQPWTVAADVAALYAKYRALGKIVWLAWPAAYDWGLMTAFYGEFAEAGSPGLGHTAVCVSSLALAVQTVTGAAEKPTLDTLGCPIADPHFPGSDAEAQGRAYFECMRRLKLPPAV